MPRAARIQYEGACYHVMCRGNRGAWIFGSESDKQVWMNTLEETCERFGFFIHAYCLMSNHYHLLLETPAGNLVRGMSWFQGTFAKRYNAGDPERGHVYHGRYKPKIVDPDPAYFGTAALYILLNPVEAGLIDPVEEDLSAYEHSSYRWHMCPPKKRPTWFKASRVLSALGIGSDSVKGRRAFQAYVKERGINKKLGQFTEEEKTAWERMERGWVHGSAEFRKAMLEVLAEDAGTAPEKVRDSNQRRDLSEHAASKALEQGLSVLGMDPETLSDLKKGDENKLLLAGWLRHHFPVSAAWCTEQLQMGHKSTVTRAWHFYKKPNKGWGRKKKELDNILILYP